MIKIAHVATVDMSIRFLLLDLLRYLQACGYDVTGISAAGPDIKVVEAAGIRHIAIPMTRRALTPLADLVSLYRLYTTFRREQFTIVHTHTPKAGFLGRWAARLAGIPIIAHTHHGFVFHENSPRLWRTFFASMERLTARWTDLVFTVTEEDIEMARLERIGDPEAFVLLGKGGIGIDTSRFDPAAVSAAARAELGLPADSKIIGFVGRLVREKGLVDLFAALEQVRARVPNVHLLIIGPVDYAKPDAVSPIVAQDLGVSDICHFLGMRYDLPQLYALMDVFVLPSHREGLPVVPMEAAAMGRPVVATNIRGCRQVVVDGETGFLVPVRDPSALADALVRVLEDDTLRSRLGHAARQFALANFDQRQVFERTTDAYRRALRARQLIT